MGEQHDGIRTPPPDEQYENWSSWFVVETRYHLFPWGPGFFAKRTSIVAASLGLAVVVTVFWILAATGRTAPVITLAWWMGWSVYECICRLYSKPWVKEGPWWGRKYRQAKIPDMIAYVMTKNLLIGAGLFLILYIFFR